MICAQPIGAGAHPNHGVLLRVLRALCEIKAFLTERAETAKQTARPIGAGAHPNQGVLLRVLCALCEIKAFLTERAESAKETARPIGAGAHPNQGVLLRVLCALCEIKAFLTVRALAGGLRATRKMVGALTDLVGCGLKDGAISGPHRQPASEAHSRFGAEGEDGGLEFW